jgi:Fe-S cluster assembly iron-binding protein IscA/alpha/beta superfamily hydrolase
MTHKFGCYYEGTNMRGTTSAILLVLLLVGCGASQPATKFVPQKDPAGAKEKVASTPDKQATSPPTEPSRGPERKNIVVLSPRAVARVKEILASQQMHFLRVMITEQNEYGLDLAPQANAEEDLLGESGGVPILVDRQSAQSLPVGLTVDFVGEEGRSGFTFEMAPPDADSLDTTRTLAEARRGFQTKLTRRRAQESPVPQPPADTFRLVHFDAEPGNLAAFLSPDPDDGQRHPAIIWITGGGSSSLGEFWQEPSEEFADFDQAASAFRKAGLIMIFPSLRGGNDNPGVHEGFFGEVDDILSAAKYLATQDYVDPQRIYLGGHSTGGTLALLAAECSDQFRAVFALGPTSDVLSYGPNYCPFAMSDPKEAELRAPIRWLHGIRSRTFVIEGTGGNLGSLEAMQRVCRNPQVSFVKVAGANHFKVLKINRLIAGKLLADTGDQCNVMLLEEEVEKHFMQE